MQQKTKRPCSIRKIGFFEWKISMYQWKEDCFNKIEGPDLLGWDTFNASADLPLHCYVSTSQFDASTQYSASFQWLNEAEISELTTAQN